VIVTDGVGVIEGVIVTDGVGVIEGVIVTDGVGVIEVVGVIEGVGVIEVVGVIVTDGVIDGVTVTDGVIDGVGVGETATFTVVSTSHGESESTTYILCVSSSKKVYPFNNSVRVTPEAIKLAGAIVV
jgi:hypothetical protein